MFILYQGRGGLGLLTSKIGVNQYDYSKQSERF